MGPSLFDDPVGPLIRPVTSPPPIDADRPIQLPGEAELRRAEERRVAGIPLHRDLHDELERLADEIGIPFLLETT